MPVFYRFLRFYNHILNKYKYPVQIATGGLLWCAGDILCQSIVHWTRPQDLSLTLNNLASKRQEDDRKKRLLVPTLDWKRVGRMSLFGLCISAPSYAFWYSFLDRISLRIFASTPPGQAMILPAWFRHILLRPVRKRIVNSTAFAQQLRTWKIIGFKLLADGVVFDPLYLSVFFSATSVMEGRSSSQIFAKLRQDLFPTYVVDVLVWSPIQTINFRFVPVVYQALIVQSCNIGWNAYLSFVQHNHDHVTAGWKKP